MLVENFLGGQQGPKPLQTLRQAHIYLHLKLLLHTFCMYVTTQVRKVKAASGGIVPEARSGPLRARRVLRAERAFREGEPVGV